jgi:subtilase family serine protease
MVLKHLARSAAVAAALACGHAALAAAPATVTGPVDDRVTVTLAGNTRPEARLANDRGALAAGYKLENMQLLLKRPAATEAALVRLIDSLHDRASPNFHHWLTAAQLGETYGPAGADIAAVTAWLTAHGFTVNGISTNRMTMDFSGTAGEVNSAFHTEMHRLDVAGRVHIANMSDPRIPAALAGVVAGVTSLNDFRPHPNVKRHPAYTPPAGGGIQQYPVVPADLAKIYNFNPVFAAGVTGTGQTVVVIEDTNIYSTADWTKFRSEFGLSTYTSGSFKQVHPTGSARCSNPGTNGDQIEAILDAEWASAAAPSATIELASCDDTSTVFGGLIALQNLINGSSPPSIVSISYGECEAENGATQNAAFYTTYQQAVGEGISVFVAAGDEGAASCDADLSNATHGIGVSGFASTPYNVAVGGTDFADTDDGTNATYWSSTNSSTYGSAKSYIPEIPWNDSCASDLLTYYNGYSTPFGSNGFCNSTAGQNDLTTASGSGGPSRCATGTPAKQGVVGGSCKGYAKPSWQSVLGNPGDGVRDIPDVSLFASDGPVWNHFYIICDSYPGDGYSCTGTPINWAGAGGTSFAAPILAGIQALVNESKGGSQGNPNTVYYKLAAGEFGSTGNKNCNSNLGRGISSACIFNDVEAGDVMVNCTGTNNCYRPSGQYGVLSTSDSSLQKAYGTSPGWDFATGIGSVNVDNLLANW